MIFTSEEALMRDPKMPAHREREPVMVAASVLALLVGITVMGALDLPTWLEAVIGAVAAFPILAVAALLRWRIAGAERADKAAEIGGRGLSTDAEILRRIAEARARGDFARWEKPVEAAGEAPGSGGEANGPGSGTPATT